MSAVGNLDNFIYCLVPADTRTDTAVESAEASYNEMVEQPRPAVRRAEGWALHRLEGLASAILDAAVPCGMLRHV